MFGGKEGGGGYPTQWALNPSAYRNVANERVDWAALAQQWIQMKESCPTSSSSYDAHPNDEEGEAPMEVEPGDGDAPPAPLLSPHAWRSANSDPEWSGGWSHKQDRSPRRPEPPPYGYTTTDSDYQYPQGYRSGYWSTDDSKSETHVSETRPQRRPPRVQPQEPPVSPSVEATPPMDAAKRRQLPAWIREGLEKMEREKQKQMDRQREKQEQDLYQSRFPGEKRNSENNYGGTSPASVPNKSKFESDSDDTEEEKKPSKEIIPKKEHPASLPLLSKTAEEMMEEVMLCVRRNLTEILLEVTNEQILSICQEELCRKRLQQQASRGGEASETQALASIGGQLGLGIYGDSTGESDTDGDTEEDDVPSKQRRKAADVTDGQLQESIKRRKAEFEKTSREIEAQIAFEEAERRDNDTSLNDEKSGENVSDSSSDGEESSANNRNELNSKKQKKSSVDKTPPSNSSRRSDKHSRDASDKASKHDKTNKPSKCKSKPKKSKRNRRPHDNKRCRSPSSSSGDTDSDAQSKRSGGRRGRSRTPSSRSDTPSSRTSDSGSNRRHSKRPKRSSSSEGSGVRHRGGRRGKGYPKRDDSPSRSHPRKNAERSRSRSRDRHGGHRKYPRYKSKDARRGNDAKSGGEKHRPDKARDGSKDKPKDGDRRRGRDRKDSASNRY